MYKPVGYWVTCDEAVCDDCFVEDEWPGFENWERPLAIFGDSERDSPTHCDTCGELIPHELTTHGYEYVRERVESGDGLPGVLNAWREAYADGGSVM